MTEAPPKGKVWNLRPEDAPWFDQKDAHRRIDADVAAGRRTGEDAALLRKWVDDGYVTLSGLLDVDAIDEMMSDLDELWRVDRAVEGLKIDEARLAPDAPPGIPHEALVCLAPEDRERIKTTSRWRVHGLQRHSKAAARIFESPRLAAVAELLFARPSAAQFTINFMYGSEQPLHQDMAVFAIALLNHLVGAWIACEDIAPESGPLVYYPGSHAERMFSEFDNYPQTHLKTCAPDVTERYVAYVNDVAARHDRRTFVAKKGDVLFWHGMLVHGGAPVLDRRLTRKSYVLHFVPPGMSVEGDVEGPFNW